MYDVNFIGQRIVPESQRKAVLIVAAAAGLALGLTLLSLGMVSLADIKVSDAYASETTELQKSVALSYPDVPTGAELEAAIDKTEPVLREVAKLVDRRTRMAPVLERVALAVPDGVWLTRVSVADPRTSEEESRARGKARSYRGIIIEGVALAGSGPEGDLSVSAFVDSLKNDRELGTYVRDLEFIGTGLKQVGGTSVVGFEISCPF